MHPTSAQIERPADPPTDEPFPPRRRLAILLLILAVALCLRLMAIGGGRYGPADDTPAFLWETEALLDGDLAGWFYLHTKPPLFAAVVALPAALGLTLGASAQIVALVAGLWMLHPAWLLLRRAGDDRSALAGLGFVAVFPLTVSLSARQLSDTTYAVILLYAIYLLIVGLVEGKVGRLAAVGVLTGLGFLTRSEALMLVPISLGLLVARAVQRRLGWRFLAAGAGAIVIPVLILSAPYVVLVSRAEGRFTVRRNFGQFLAYSAGVEEKKTPTTGRGPAIVEVVSRHAEEVAASWPMHFAKYIYEMTSRSMGYIGAAFAVVGLWACRRRLWRWAPCQLGVLIYLLALVQLSVFKPAPRMLSGLIVLLAWPIGVGAVEIARAIVRLNPARIARPQRAFGWLVAALIATVAAPSIANMYHGPRNDFDPGQYPSPLRTGAQAPDTHPHPEGGPPGH